MNKIDLYNRAIGILTEVQALRDALKPDKTPPKSSETEKVPTPASDSVKGEVDKFERKIIRRNNDILLVEVGNGWTVCKDNGTVFWGASGIKKWVTEQSPQVRSTNEYAHALKLFSEATAAKSLELPTANPAASAKGKPFSPTESWQEWIETEAEGAAHVLRDHDNAIAELLRRIEDLEREVAALKAVK